MINLYWLEQIRSTHRASVGLKALHLSHLLQEGCPVVPGFVVSAETLRAFLETINWVEPFFTDLPGSSLHLDIDNPQQLQAIARQLRQAIAAAPLPDSLLQELETAVARFHPSPLILRASLIVNSRTRNIPEPMLSDLALGGSRLLTSQFCPSDVRALAQGLKKLWGELFGAKTLFYWQRYNVPIQQIGLGVLVQLVQPAIASGIVRTTDSHFEIYSTIGLGMAISRGEVIPDYDQIDAATNSVQTRQLGQKSIAYRLVGQLSSGMEAESYSSEPCEPLIFPNWQPSIGDTTILQSNADSPNPSSLVEAYLLSEPQRSSFTLTETTIQTLIHLTRTALASSRIPLELEWILLPESRHPPRLYLTQANPQPPPTRNVALPVINKRAHRPVEIFPGAVLIATGLSVASGQAIARASVVTDIHTLPTDFLPHTILVTPTVPLDWLPLIEQSAALVSEYGSMTSHSAIIAREIGIPAVTGVPAITAQIQPGELLWVDGDRGKIYRLNQAPASSPTMWHDAPFLPSQPLDSAPSHIPLVTGLMVNLSQPNQVLKAAHLPITGVGLLRAELLALTALDNQHPRLWLEQNRKHEFVERMISAIARFAEAFDPRPVFYRSFDFRPHEFQNLHLTSPLTTAHSTLGMRGTFSYMQNATLFKLELAYLATLQQAGHTNIHLILPFVRTVEEFLFCRRLVEQAGLTRLADFQLWIMAEVPSVLLLLPDYVSAGVQGISIGTNDLTQLLLGADRDSAELAAVFEERHPAVQRAIAHLIQEAGKLGIPCSICGEAPVRYPEMIIDLVRWGIQSISVAPEAVETTYWEIARAEQMLLLESLRSP
ncbi:MAG: phosphoenolpyruvate synthase [Oscillatoriales cyanobacterium C42_A2020_001]|nr:phosphoenolpyruvate synthase [Leptolyngbyaceae cyanobacterium C42_A2020_001]